jgi:hypothetical protein
MRQYTHITLILCLLQAIFFPLYGKNTIVYGQDSTYAGSLLELYSWDDGWGYTKTVLDTCTVQADGTYRFEFELTETRKAHIPLGKYMGSLFVEPGKTYSINLPEYALPKTSDLLNPYYEPQELLLSFNNLPINDLNQQIALFEDAFDAQWAQLLTEHITPQRIEQAMHRIDSICPPAGIPFMEQYRQYRYALMVNLHTSSAPDLSIRTYFLKQPVYYMQPAYWEAFEAIFPHFDHLSGLHSNTPLFELAMMQKVEQGDLPVSKLRHIQTPQNAKIAHFIEKKKQILQVGYHVEIDTLVNIHGETILWDDYQFPQAYVIFGHTNLRETLADIDYVAKMYNKYKNKCLFLLIFTDDNNQTIQQACKALKRYPFAFSTADNPNLVKSFKQTHTPAYYLLDANSNLAQVPAPEPKNFVP